MQAFPPEGLIPPLSPLQDVCENATVALFVMDERQYCVYMKRAAELLTGFTLAEVQGRPLHDLIHHHHPDGMPYPLAECPIDHAAPHNSQEHGEEVFVHKSGRFYPVAFTASPIRREGRVVGIVIEVQDISARKQQEAEREAMRKIGLLILQEMDVGKIVQAVTDAATQLTGAQFGAFFYKHTDPTGASYPLYALSGAPREAFAKFPVPRETGLLAPSFRGEATLRVGDIQRDERYGKTAPYLGMPPGHLPVRSYLAVPVKLGNGDAVGALLFGHEAANVFTAEHERLVEALADQAAIAVNKAQLFEAAQQARVRAEHEAQEKGRLYQEAEQENRKKEEFLATLAHELRNPLSPLRNAAQLLTAPALNADQLRWLQCLIERQVGHMARLLDDLLDLARITRGKLHLVKECVSLASVVGSAMEAARPLIDQKRHVLEVSLDEAEQGALVLQADPVRLSQVLCNLLTNAAKYTDAGGRIELTARRLGAELELSVRDNGIGLPPHSRKHIFEMFGQLESGAGRAEGGLGIGLALVRGIVELHGGQVGVDSPGLGQGTCFTVRLPLDEAPQLPPFSQQAGIGMPRAGLKVLIADDNEDAGQTLALLLLSHGCDARAVNSGQAAIEMAAHWAPHVAVLDIGMPGIDGHATPRHARCASSPMALACC